jgi:hypothetical protein
MAKSENCNTTVHNNNSNISREYCIRLAIKLLYMYIFIILEPDETKGNKANIAYIQFKNVFDNYRQNASEV